MNYRMIISLLGKIMLICATLLVLPLIISIIYSDRQVLPFVYTIAIFVGLGLLSFLAKPKSNGVYAKEGMAIVALTWIIFSVIGGLPFYFSGQIPSFIDCIFETASGFTTTGSSIIKDVEKISKSLLFWRSFTHWIGGMGVLVFVTALFTSKNSHTTYLMRAEMPGPQVGKLTSKWQFSIRILYAIYIVLTLIQFVLLLLGGMDAFDSLVHTFGTAGTGGFGIWSTSVGHYDSAYIDCVIGIFMVIFSVNFNIYYMLLARQLVNVKENDELKLFVCIVLGATLIIALNILDIYGNFKEAVRYSFFQVSSIISTTGYATADFTKWPMLSQMVLLILMFIGGCAGSTAGGIKVIRVRILLRHAINEIKRSFSPRTVITIKNDGKLLDNSVVQGVTSYLAVYAFVMALSILIVSLDNFDAVTTITSVVTALNNVGPGLSLVGPLGNFSEFSVLSKIVLTFDMLAGRLELFAMLSLFSPSLWRK